MDILEAMQQRHSVRSYLNRPIDPAVSAALRQTIETCNRESGLHIQLVTDEPKAFDSTMAHYGKFSGVTNYIAIIGRKEAGLNERCGYYGEKIVLQAQMLGLNTCWVGLTFKKIPDAFQVAAGEKLVIVIAIGYGASPGTAHPTRPMDAVSRSDGPMPAWFRDGVGGSSARADSRQSAEIHIDPGRRSGVGQSRSGILQQSGSRHCEISF